MHHEGLLCAAHNIACEAAALEFPLLMPEVYAACQSRIASGALWDGMYPLKLLELRCLLQTYKPQTVVEIGSGATTLVLREHCPSVVSIEDKDWGGTATRVVDGEFVRFAETLELVKQPPDFLYVDGPNSRHKLISTDAADLIAAGVLPRFIAFDLRHESVQHTMKAAAGKYAFVPSQLVAPSAGLPWFTASLKIHSLLVRVT